MVYWKGMVFGVTQMKCCIILDKSLSWASASSFQQFFQEVFIEYSLGTISREQYHFCSLNGGI